jgi:hypothetical protein
MEDDDALCAFSLTGNYCIVRHGGKLELAECAVTGSGVETVTAGELLAKGTELFHDLLFKDLLFTIERFQVPCFKFQVAFGNVNQIASFLAMTG